MDKNGEIVFPDE